MLCIDGEDFSGHILDDPTGGKLTIFSVVKPKGGYYILSTGAQTSAYGYALSYQNSDSFSSFRDSNGTAETLINNLFDANKTHLVTHSYSATYIDSEVKVNGEKLESSFTSGNTQNDQQMLTIGRPNNTEDYYGNFEIAEVIVISSTDSQKITEIQNYLSNKWNLTSTIDSDGDGFTDAVEKVKESSPTDNNSIPDGMPSILGQAELWLDASNIDGEGNISISNGNSVSEWKDISGNGNNAIQSTVSNQPSIASTAQNNNNVISFTNTDELEIPDDESIQVGDQNYGIFLVVKKTGDNTQYLLSKGRAGHNGTNYRRYYTYMTDSLFGHEIDEDPQWHAVETAQYFYSEYKLIYTERNSGYLNNYIDGIFENSTELPNGYGSLDETSPTSMIIGGKPWGSTTSNADYAEIIMFKKALSNDERNQVVAYLSEKWGLTATLDSNLMGEGSGLMAYYSFDGNSNDSSGNGLNGTLNGATLTSDKFGNSDRAYSFDGNDYIEISDDQKLTSTNQLSIVAWFKKSSNSELLTIMQKGSDDTNEEYILSVHNSNIYFDVGDGGGPYIQPSYSVSSGVWHHIVAVHNRTGGNSSLKIYLNGQNIGGTVINPTRVPMDNSDSVTIGKRKSYSTQSFIGQIDEVRIYNRALSDEDISTLYNSY